MRTGLFVLCGGNAKNVTVSSWLDASVPALLLRVESVRCATAASVPEWAARSLAVVVILELILAADFANRGGQFASG
jgi:hypothetical protein